MIHCFKSGSDKKYHAAPNEEVYVDKLCRKLKTLQEVECFYERVKMLEETVKGMIRNVQRIEETNTRIINMMMENRTRIENTEGGYRGKRCQGKTVVMQHGVLKAPELTDSLGMCDGMERD
eukprot:765280-Hanusia_phi.AAC.3